MKKKLLYVLISALLISGLNISISKAAQNSEEFSQQLEQMAEQLKITGKKYGEKFLPFYTKLQTCSVYKDDIAEVYGKKNNQCHFRMMNYDCNAPIEVSEYYGLMGKNVMAAMAEWDTNTLDVLLKKKQQYTDFENTTIKYYCKPQ